MISHFFLQGGLNIGSQFHIDKLNYFNIQFENLILEQRCVLPVVSMFEAFHINSLISEMLKLSFSIATFF